MNYAYLTMALAAGFLLGLLLFMVAGNIPPGDDD